MAFIYQDKHSIDDNTSQEDFDTANDIYNIESTPTTLIKGTITQQSLENRFNIVKDKAIDIDDTLYNRNTNVANSIMNKKKELELSSSYIHNPLSNNPLNTTVSPVMSRSIFMNESMIDKGEDVMLSPSDAMKLGEVRNVVSQYFALLK